MIFIQRQSIAAPVCIPPCLADLYRTFNWFKWVHIRCE